MSAVLEPVPAISSKTTIAAKQKPKVALVLQGGGALGAYHLGAFQALTAAGYQPDWVAGISIGAFNAAIIAGNPPARRLEKLTAFWEEISWWDVPFGAIPPFATWHNELSNLEALTIGQRNFFTPRLINPLFLPDGPPTTLSFYDTAPVLKTLGDHADFDRINAGETRLTLGATNLATGNLTWFDNQTDRHITPKHVLASGSLPPGFPATEIDGALYWDGGCVSNSPLAAVAAGQGAEHLLVFVIDLWNAAGKPPATMNDVFWRAKQIQYASRAQRDVQVVKTAAQHYRGKDIATAAGLHALDGLPDAPALEQGRLDIVHIIYRPGPDQIPNSDAEFSRSSIAARRAAGLHDMRRALEAAPWTRTPTSNERAHLHPF